MCDVSLNFGRVVALKRATRSLSTDSVYASHPPTMDIKTVKFAKSRPPRDSNRGTSSTLRTAIQKGDTETVRRSIQDGGVHPDSIRVENMSPLQYASKHGLTQLLEVLLEAGCDVEKVTGKHKCSAMYLACRHDDSETSLRMVKRLLAHGADANQRGKFHRTPLVSAIVSGHLGVVRELCQHGADVNGREGDGKSPLFLAARGGRADIILLLCRNGADINASDSEGRTALFRDSKTGKQADVVALMLELGAHINKVNRWGMTPLMYAAKRGDHEMVSRLCASGADVGSADHEGSTALAWAVRRDDVQMMSNLSTYGADVNALITNDTTPLVWSASHGCVKMASALCSLGADVNLSSKDGTTPLIAAALCADTEMVRELCKCGADVNKANEQGHTALTACAERVYKSSEEEDVEDYIENVRTLVEAAPMLTMSNSRYKPLLHFLDVMQCWLSRNCQFFPGAEVRGLFCDCLVWLLSAGCHVGQEEYEMMTSDTLRPLLVERDVLEYASQKCVLPCSLRRLCKLAIRNKMPKPLTQHVSDAGLPEHLQKYILLEISD